VAPVRGTQVLRVAVPITPKEPLPVYNTMGYNVVNKKIRFMTDYVTAVVVSCIMKDTGLSVSEAMKAFYNSEVFDRLCDIETGLYSESGSYVHDLYKIEKEHGRLVQMEI